MDNRYNQQGFEHQDLPPVPPVPAVNPEITPKYSQFKRLRSRMDSYRIRQNETEPKFSQTFHMQSEANKQETLQLKERFLDTKTKRTKGKKNETRQYNKRPMEKSNSNFEPNSKIPCTSQGAKSQSQNTSPTTFSVEIVQQLEFSTKHNSKPQQISTNITVKTQVKDEQNQDQDFPDLDLCAAAMDKDASENGATAFGDISDLMQNDMMSTSTLDDLISDISDYSKCPDLMKDFSFGESSKIGSPFGSEKVDMSPYSNNEIFSPSTSFDKSQNDIKSPMSNENIFQKIKSPMSNENMFQNQSNYSPFEKSSVTSPENSQWNRSSEKNIPQDTKPNFNVSQEQKINFNQNKNKIQMNANQNFSIDGQFRGNISISQKQDISFNPTQQSQTLYKPYTNQSSGNSGHIIHKPNPIYLSHSSKDIFPQQNQEHTQNKQFNYLKQTTQPSYSNNLTEQGVISQESYHKKMMEYNMLEEQNTKQKEHTQQHTMKQRTMERPDNYQRTVENRGNDSRAFEQTMSQGELKHRIMEHNSIVRHNNLMQQKEHRMKQQNIEQRPTEQKNFEQRATVQMSMNQKALEDRMLDQIVIDERNMPLAEQQQMEQRALEQHNIEQNNLEQRNMEQRVVEQWKKEQRSLEQRKMERQALEQRNMEQRALEQRNIEQRALEERNMEQRALEQRNMEQRLLEQRNMEQRALEQRNMEQRALEQRNMDQRALEQRNMEQRVLEQRNMEQRALEQRNLEQRTLEQQNNSRFMDHTTMQNELMQQRALQQRMSEENAMKQRTLEQTYQMDQSRQRTSQHSIIRMQQTQQMSYTSNFGSRMMDQRTLMNRQLMEQQILMTQSTGRPPLFRPQISGNDSSFQGNIGMRTPNMGQIRQLNSTGIPHNYVYGAQNNTSIGQNIINRSQPMNINVQNIQNAPNLYNTNMQRFNMPNIAQTRTQIGQHFGTRASGLPLNPGGSQNPRLPQTRLTQNLRLPQTALSQNQPRPSNLATRMPYNPVPQRHPSMITTMQQHQNIAYSQQQMSSNNSANNSQNELSFLDSLNSSELNAFSDQDFLTTLGDTSFNIDL